MVKFLFYIVKLAFIGVCINILDFVSNVLWVLVTTVSQCVF